MRLIMSSTMLFLLAGCGNAGASGGAAPPALASEIAAGEWEVTGTLGGPVPSASNLEPPMTRKTCLRPAETGAMAARAALLQLVPVGSCKTDELTIKDHYLSGSLACRGVDDIPDHNQTVSGTYGKDWFQMTIDIPVFGTIVRQTIDGKRIGDCS